jgi:hypothetical protein
LRSLSRWRQRHPQHAKCQSRFRGLNRRANVNESQNKREDVGQSDQSGRNAIAMIEIVRLAASDRGQAGVDLSRTADRVNRAANERSRVGNRASHAGADRIRIVSRPRPVAGGQSKIGSQPNRAPKARNRAANNHRNHGARAGGNEEAAGEDEVVDAVVNSKVMTKAEMIVAGAVVAGTSRIASRNGSASASLNRSTTID